MAKCYMSTSKTAVGFGETKEEADRDLLVNELKNGTLNQLTPEFVERRKVLSPWMPKENMLHISSVGCLVYDGQNIIEQKSGRSRSVINTDFGIYDYLSNLVGGLLTYEDITVVLRQEINKFFGNISKSFIRIEDMPIVRLLNASTGFIPNTIYNTDCSLLIGVQAGQTLGMKYIGSDYFYCIDIENTPKYIPLIPYLGYRLDTIITRERIIVE